MERVAAGNLAAAVGTVADKRAVVPSKEKSQKLFVECRNVHVG